MNKKSCLDPLAELEIFHMKTLVKCKFYLITLLAAALSIAGTATSDDQTNISIGDVKQMEQKPTIMILGSSHLANPGMDSVNPKIDDVLAPKRQAEIQQLVTQLKRFQPTKIALEVDFSRDAEINAAYQDYLKGTYQLTRGEGDQIGYRLAKQMEHSKVYCVDYFRSSKENPIFNGGIDSDLIDRSTFAKKHNQKHLFGSHPGDPGKVIVDADGTVWIEPEKYEPIIDMLIRLNQPAWSRTSQRAYLHDARVGLGDEYPGVNWLAHLWYARNLKIFVNLTRITESTDDRILLIIGAGHVYLVQQFLEESGDYIIESPLKYLDAAEK